jgi:hypothetical protein
MADEPTTTTTETAGEAQALRVTLAGQSWVFSEDDTDNTDLIDIEDATGWTTAEWLDQIGRGSMRALTALVWHFQRKDKPGLALVDVKFRAKDLGVEFLREGDGEGKAPSAGSSTATSSPSPSISA